MKGRHFCSLETDNLIRKPILDSLSLYLLPTTLAYYILTKVSGCSLTLTSHSTHALTSGSLLARAHFLSTIIRRLLLLLLPHFRS